jgi:hypothetical protein
MRDVVERYDAGELPAGVAIALLIGDYIKGQFPGFVAGSFVTVGLAWVWSFWL